MSKTPKNWPLGTPYISTPFHGKDISAPQKQILKTKPPSGDAPSIPSSSTQLPCPLVRIQPIDSHVHPAHGQSGLFAARDLKAGSFIVPYLGRTHGSSTTDTESDYDLWLDKEGDLAVDAAHQGNEARFVNDYRGVRERPNAEFGLGWSEQWGQICVGFWVKRGKREGIRKGEEILVSYGKGFWGGRREDDVGEEYYNPQKDAV